MCDSNIASIESPCDALSVDAPGMFRFDVIYNCAVLREGVEEVRMAWNMVLRGWKVHGFLWVVIKLPYWSMFELVDFGFDWLLWKLVTWLGWSRLDDTATIWSG
ncbi:hypothetical protein HKD37_20G056662 [Glycine soja]